MSKKRMNLGADTRAQRAARVAARARKYAEPIRHHASYQYTDATSGKERDSTASIQRDYTEGNASRTRRVIEARNYNRSARKLS